MTISYAGNFCRLLFRWKGSIWRSVWKELVAFLAMFYAVRFIYDFVLPYFDPDGDYKYRKTFENLSRMFEDYTRQIPLTFLLGFYVSNVVTRWAKTALDKDNWPFLVGGDNSKRSAGPKICFRWHGIFECGTCKYFSTIIPGLDEKSQRRRLAIARYVNLSAGLAWRDISIKIRRRFPSTRQLVTAGLLTEKEYAKLEAMQDPGTRWLAPLHWIQLIVAEEEKENKPLASLVNQFIHELKQYRISYRKLFCHDWVCVPLVYTQVAALATYAYFFFCLIGRQFLETKEDDGKSEIDFYVPIFTIVQFLFFVGWFKVGQDLMRPFGLDDDDIEMNYIFDRNVRTSFAIVTELQMQGKVELDDEDMFWKSRDGTTPEIPHTTLSKKIAEHPPKLHCYVRLKNKDSEEVDEEGKKQQCLKEWQKKRYISW